MYFDYFDICTHQITIICSRIFSGLLCNFLFTFSNMTRPMPIWYVRNEGRFVNPSSDEAFDVCITRVQKRSVSINNILCFYSNFILLPFFRINVFIYFCFYVHQIFNLLFSCCFYQPFLFTNAHSLALVLTLDGWLTIDSVFG